MNCAAPADAQEFVACSIAEIQPIVDAIFILGGVLVTCALALAGMRLAIKLIRMA